MPNPSRLLQPGERVVLEVRPHWWHLARPVAVGVGAVALAGVAIGQRWPRPVDAIVAGTLVVALLWLVGRYVRWSAALVVVTNDRVVQRRGPLRRHRVEVPLASVLDVRVRQSVGQRVLRAGDVVLEWAGGSEVLGWVHRPGGLRRDLRRHVDAARQQPRTPTASSRR